VILIGVLPMTRALAVLLYFSGKKTI